MGTPQVALQSSDVLFRQRVPLRLQRHGRGLRYDVALGGVHQLVVAELYGELVRIQLPGLLRVGERGHVVRAVPRRQGPGREQAQAVVPLAVYVASVGALLRSLGRRVEVDAERRDLRAGTVLGRFGAIRC